MSAKSYLLLVLRRQMYRMKTKGGNDANNLSRKMTPGQYPVAKKSLGDYPFLRQIVKGLRQDLRSKFFFF